MIIIMSIESHTPQKELSMTIINELTSFIIDIKYSISETRKVQLLSLMIK